MRDDQKIRFEDLFQMPMDELCEKLEFGKDEEKRFVGDQFADYDESFGDVFIEYFMNCVNAQKIAESAPHSCRLGYDSCKSASRKTLRESLGWEKLYHIGRLGALLGQLTGSLEKGLLGLPKVAGAIELGPGGVKVLNGGSIPPEIMEQIKRFAMDMTKKIVDQDGDTVPGDLEQLLGSKKPTAPTKPKDPPVKSQAEISAEADRIIDQNLKPKPPTPPETGDAKK